MATLQWQTLDTAGSWPQEARAKDFLSGFIALEGEASGTEAAWVRPLRFTREQIRALSSVAAWHPALYRAQALSTAGICVEVVTSATRFGVEVARESGSARVGDEMADASEDGFSVDVDARHVEGVLDVHGEGLLVIDLSDEEGAKERLVRLWLPVFSPCRVRGLFATADVAPAPARKSLLVLGGSVAQGQNAHDPGLGWAQSLRREADLEVVNQGLLSQVFQPSALSPLAGRIDPDLVWVAYGGAYRHEECYAGAVERDARAALGVLRRLWRDRPTWIQTPTHHDEGERPSMAKSCWREFPGILERISERWPQFELVDGEDLLDADPSLMDDADHPNAAGHAQMAKRITRVLAGKPPITEREREDRALPSFLRARGGMAAPTARAASPEAKDLEAAQVFEEEALAEAAEVAPIAEPEVEAEDEALARSSTGVAEEAIEQEMEPEPEDDAVSSAAATAVLDARAIRRALKADAPSRGTARVREVDIDAVLALFAEGPLDSVPMEQIVARGLGKMSYASEGFATVDLPDGTRYFWGTDVIEAKRAMARQTRPSLAVVLSPELEGVLRRTFSTNEASMPYTLVVYEGTDPLPVEAELDIRTLAPSWASVIRKAYSFPEGASAAEIAHLLAKGQILGGFDLDNQLVGFIGEHPDGALGMLEVFPRARRRGFGSALLAAKANEHLAKGWTPFSQVMAANDASLALHEALGFEVVKTRQIYIPMEG